MPALLPGRVNNRGPPRFTEIPFEAIPLEILSSQRPGQQPVQIQQRPFHTRIKITKTKLPPPFATGIPLPEVLIPGYEKPTTMQTTEEPTTTLQDETTTDVGPTATTQNSIIEDSNVGNDGVDLNLIKSDLDELVAPTTTIYATASRVLPKWPPLRRPVLPYKAKIESTSRRPSISSSSVTRTPPLVFPKDELMKKPEVQAEPEVLFSGQAFDIKPSRQPSSGGGGGRPDIFDLTVSAAQNFGGGKKVFVKPQGKCYFFVFLVANYLQRKASSLHVCSFCRWNHYETWRHRPICLH